MMSVPALTCSVVIPTYNGSAFIGEALESVFAQTRLPDEVIVVDDASTDGTPDKVTHIAKRTLIPVTLIRLERNSGGPARPLNVGIQAAQGEIVALLEQDDVFEPAKVERQWNLLQHAPGVELAFSFCRLSLHERGSETRPPAHVVEQLIGRSAAVPPCPPAYVLPSSAALRALLEHGVYGNVLTGFPALLFKKSLWERKGGFDERLMIASDFDFVCWASGRHDVAFVPEPLYVRRWHAANLSGRVELARWESSLVLERYLPGNRQLLADATFRARMRTVLRAAAYHARNERQYQLAMRYYRLAQHHAGPYPAWAIDVAKLLAHRALYARLVRRGCREIH